jgi:peptidoglycan/xylan/chitin deacetylase (PgdA/CDA1 family)
VVLTFDDGPHPEGTPAILEILARADAAAIFFFIGRQVERHPELAARIASEGHLIALHGYRHRLQLRMRARDVEADLARGAAAIEDATATQVRWHRPPYGIYSPAGLEAARARGLQPLLWSRWGKDWRRFTTPRRIAVRVTGGLAAMATGEVAVPAADRMRAGDPEVQAGDPGARAGDAGVYAGDPGVQAGDVILLHDADHYSAKHSHRRTAEALPLILTELRRRGLGTVLPA